MSSSEGTARRALLAAAAAMAGAGCYGVATPLMKRATTRMEPLTISASIHLGATVFMLPGGAWLLPNAEFTPAAVGAVLMLGVVTSGLAYWIHLRILRHVPPVAAMSPAFLIPLFGVTWGHLFLNEPLGSGLYLGGAFVLLATALVTGFNPWRRPYPTPPT